MVPFIILSMKGRSTATFTSLAATATVPFTPFAAPLVASKLIVSPDQAQVMPSRSAMPFARSSAFAFASAIGREWDWERSMVAIWLRYTRTRLGEKSGAARRVFSVAGRCAARASADSARRRVLVTGAARGRGHHRSLRRFSGDRCLRSLLSRSPHP